MVLVAEGQNIESLSGFEGIFNEGDKGEVRIYLSNELTMAEIQKLQDDIVAKGVVLSEPIVQDMRIVVIKFEKRIAPLLIIAAAIGVAIIGWQLFKAISAIPWWTWLVGGGTVLYLLTRKGAKWLG